MEYRPLPIGIDNFQEIIERSCYYVDKTLLIKNLVDTTTKVTLFTRPRRFGKSLNLSMLQSFFECSATHSREDTKQLFQGLNIASAGENYTKHMGQYPVIVLDFKEAKQGTFQESYDMLIQNIAREFARHEDQVMESQIKAKELEVYQAIRNREASKDNYLDSIRFLCECLEKTHDKKAILLIDEYDVPLENAYFRGYYQEMVDFIRGLLSGALKTNTSLGFAVMTGCLRVSKESIFTGLNNLEIISIENKQYGEYFGFTQVEVEEMLVHYGKEQHMEQVREWYNGYLFGDAQVYNPWSLINHMKKIVVNDTEVPKPYWSNTSSNSIVRELIERADEVVREELEVLLSGGTIEQEIQEDITYEDVYRNRGNLWNFLYFTGYLKKIQERFDMDTVYATLQIPNKEVRYIYRNHIMEWTQERIEQEDLANLYEATLSGNELEMEAEIDRILQDSISYYDGNSTRQGEAFYHGIMAGLYQGMKGYRPLSNRESGNGRPDLILKYVNHKGKACILEFKVATDVHKLETAAMSALAQVKERDYRQGLRAEGYEEIIEYGIGFYKKSCIVKKV